MQNKVKLIILLVAIWAVIFVASYFMSVGIEGPRNIDTGLKRLDVLARYQIVAFLVAVISGVAGIAWRRESKRIMLVGLTPLLITLLLIAGIVGATMIFNKPLSPEEAYQPPKRPTSALAVPVAPQD